MRSLTGEKNIDPSSLDQHINMLFLLRKYEEKKVFGHIFFTEFVFFLTCLVMRESRFDEL